MVVYTWMVNLYWLGTNISDILQHVPRKQGKTWYLRWKLSSSLSTVSNLEKENYRRTPCVGLKEHNLIPKEPASITLKDINLLINKRLRRWLLNVQMLCCDDQCLQAYKAEPARETIFTAACCLHREQIVQFHRVPSTNLRYLYLCWAWRNGRHH